MNYDVSANNVEDKRCSKRIEATLDVSIAGKGAFKTTNISREGAFIAFTNMANYNVGPQATLSITLPESKDPVTAEAEFVRYRLNEPSGFAVKFNNISDEYVDFYESQLS